MTNDERQAAPPHELTFPADRLSYSDASVTVRRHRSGGISLHWSDGREQVFKPETWEKIVQTFGVAAAPAQAQPQPTANPSVIGSLWLCYHAIKSSEWTNIKELSHPCAYCGNDFSLGHDENCMIGNGLKWMESATSDGAAQAHAPTPATTEDEDFCAAGIA